MDMLVILFVFLFQGVVFFVLLVFFYVVLGEDSVDFYVVSDCNIGVGLFIGDSMVCVFKGQVGICCIVDCMVVEVYKDCVIGEIFEGYDKVCLICMLFE